MTAALVLILSVVSANSSEYPFTAEVIVEEAEVRAGSGRRFYLTDRLQRGTRVEVHRRDPGGWYAIRPTEGSFSWVPAEQVNLTDDPDVAEVTAEEAVSWIGSRVDKITDHRYQIELKMGERLEILGEKKIPTAEGDQVWYKIAPPAGEFRWIHSRDVRGVVLVNNSPPETVKPSAPREQLVAAEPAPSSPGGFRPRGKVELQDLASAGKTPRDRELNAIRPAAYAEGQPQPPNIPAVDVTALERNIARETNPEKKTDGFVPRGTRWSNSNDVRSSITTDQKTGPKTPEPLTLGTGVAPKPLLSERIASLPATNSTTPPPTKRYSRQEIDAELAAVDAELSLMVAGDSRTWNLARLRARVEQLIEQADNATDRGRGRLLVEKIHKFAETFGVEDDPKYAGITTPAAANSEKVIGSGAREAGVPSALDPKYDGQGWLKPVIAHNKPAVAPYAIVDKDGKPVAFVTPSPGLNLNLYKDRRVGLYGRRGYLEALRTPHITAERVIDLDRHLR